MDSEDPDVQRAQLKGDRQSLNLTESRVSQVLHLALTKLREHLKGSPLAQRDWQQSPG
jgi:DNA-directed RNA polymerase sigma subunit (sigma70/sigma32)